MTAEPDEEKFLPPLAKRATTSAKHEDRTEAAFHAAAAALYRSAGSFGRWRSLASAVRALTRRHWRRSRNGAMSRSKTRSSCRPNWAKLVIQLMEDFFPEILNVEFTAHMEDDLDHMEEGKEDGCRCSTLLSTVREAAESCRRRNEEVEIQDEVSR